MKETGARQPSDDIYETLRDASRKTIVDGPASIQNVSDLLNATLGAEQWDWEYRVLRDEACDSHAARAREVTVKVRLSVRATPKGMDVRRIGIGIGKDPSYGTALRKAVSDGLARAAAQAGAWTDKIQADASPKPPVRQLYPGKTHIESAEWQEDESRTDNLGKAQVRHIHIMLRRLRWTGQEYREFLLDRYGVRLGTDLSRAQREDLIFDLGKMFRAMEERKIAS